MIANLLWYQIKLTCVIVCVFFHLEESDLDESADTLFEHECEFEDEDTHTVVDDDVNREEDGLWNKLCTYTITQKKFMNQHW